MEPKITTVSGEWFDFTNPLNSKINIYDIAHALANTCRFSGHSSRFYSVAQHSIWVSKIVPPEDALAGLMHDAAEAFIGDVTKPLKEILPDYQRVEGRIETAVRIKFRVPVNMPGSVKEADLVMLATERRDLMPNNNSGWSILRGVKPLKKKIRWCPIWLVRWRFLARFRKLQKIQREGALRWRR